MCSDRLIVSVLLLLCMNSCHSYRKVQDISAGRTSVVISVPDDDIVEKEPAPAPVTDSIRDALADGPILMKAIRDSETGEMVATDIINASRVVARFRNVAERGGSVVIGFDVVVPQNMMDSRFQLKLRPYMTMEQDTVALEPLHVTGERYRTRQLRGYERYRAFLATIITDTAAFLHMRQLELFIERNFPEMYAMKTDSAYVSDDAAESVFGITKAQAVKHYTNSLKIRMNEHRKQRMDKMRSRYIRDPIVSDRIRLDTVLRSVDGDFIYRYVHEFRSRPGLKKVGILLDGNLYENGLQVARMPSCDPLTFYISSLGGLLDDRPRYRIIIRERTVYDNTKALIDFGQGSAKLDTTLGDNASEMARLLNCIDDVGSIGEFELDSLLITASCSLEGRFEYNRRLSKSRAETVKDYLSAYVPDTWKELMYVSEQPENWEQFFILIENDTLLSPQTRMLIDGLKSLAARKPDVAESRLAALPEYRYLREKVYPKLRSVRFDFHLHRKGMIKDTTHTSELDSVYMAGLDAVRNMDYKRGVALLRSYGDYNSALAYMAAGYDHSALDILRHLERTDPKVCYLMAVVLSRLEQDEEARKYLQLAVAYQPSLKFRANLDPEMSELIKKL